MKIGQPEFRVQPVCANLLGFSPFKGEGRRGMGSKAVEFTPIPSPILPYCAPYPSFPRKREKGQTRKAILNSRGREKCSGALKLAHTGAIKNMFEKEGITK